jgi:predicted RNA-binding protein with PIN domain
MLVYIIDAFNLIHKIGSMCDSSTPHNDLINFIKTNRLIGSSNNRVVIVFDGHEGPGVYPGREYQLVFSGDRTADDEIKERVLKAKNKSQLIVVSDDRDVRGFARREGAQVKSTGEFLSKPVRPISFRAPGDEKEISYDRRMKINRELEKIWVKK